MVNGKSNSVNSVGAHAEGAAGTQESQRQSEARPTSSRAIIPPRNSAARIQNATCGRLRISPRGGSVSRAKSSASSSVSSTGWRTPWAASGVVAGSCASSLNSRGTKMMLAPKKSTRQGKVCAKSAEEEPLYYPINDAQQKTSRCSNRALVNQNSHQRECHDGSRQDCQQHPTAQLWMRLRQAQQVNGRIGSVKNFRARRALRGRERLY